MVKAKLTVIVVLSACLLLGFASFAYAAEGDTDYLDWNEVSALPGQGTSPHGGYSTTTSKCAVCHSVHAASFMGESLLQSPAAEACEYCHVGGAGGYTQVYDGNPANYSGSDLPNAHNYLNDGLGNVSGVACFNCHSVHAADNRMTDNAYLTQRLLIGPKTAAEIPGVNSDPLAGLPRSTDTSDTALAKWCATCHFTLGGTYTYWGEYNGASHVMTTATASYSGSGSYTGKVAWQDSNYCASCHASGYQTPAWPHYTEGVRFLVAGANASESVPATNTSQDGICLRCHRSADGDGIGIDY